MCKLNDEIDAALETAETVGSMPDDFAGRILSLLESFIQKYGSGISAEWDHRRMELADLNSAHQVATWMANHNKESTQ